MAEASFDGYSLAFRDTDWKFNRRCCARFLTCWRLAAPLLVRFLCLECDQQHGPRIYQMIHALVPASAGETTGKMGRQ